MKNISKKETKVVSPIKIVQEHHHRKQMVVSTIKIEWEHLHLSRILEILNRFLQGQDLRHQVHQEDFNLLELRHQLRLEDLNSLDQEDHPLACHQTRDQQCHKEEVWELHQALLL